jgi:hypothetical protein
MTSHHQILPSIRVLSSLAMSCLLAVSAVMVVVAG